MDGEIVDAAKGRGPFRRCQRAPGLQFLQGLIEELAWVVRALVLTVVAQFPSALYLLHGAADGCDRIWADDDQ